MIRSLSLLFIVFLSLSARQVSAAPNTLLILGDSLSAGYQMKIEQSWPSLLAQELQAKGKNVTIINASVSGDTTGNAVQRVTGLLSKHQPHWVLIELGANDGLRGFNIRTITANLTTLITTSQQSGAKVFLMQIRIPPNYGKRYNQAFMQQYPQLAKQFSLPLIPFFLESVIEKPQWMMSDGLHPNAKAQPWIAQFMATQLQPLLTP